MVYDTKVPRKLQSTQEWFAGIITQPIDDRNRINPIARSGCSIVDEAPNFILPSPTLNPHNRIELYNQQYWWRLLSRLQESFPLTTRLFGYYDFNQKIAFPYFVKHPPRHWSLNLIGDRLAQWVNEDYPDSDKELIYDAVRIDWAFQQCFTERALPSLNEATDEITEIKLTTQPFVHLFAMRNNLLETREEFLKQEPEYWLEHDFPVIKKDKTYFYTIYRNPHNRVWWAELEQGAYFLLNLFRQGCTIDEACQVLENESPTLRQAAEERLHLWFQEFVIKGFLAVEKD